MDYVSYNQFAWVGFQVADRAVSTNRLRLEFLWSSIVFCTIRSCLKVVSAYSSRPSFTLTFTLSISSGVEEFTNPRSRPFTRQQHLMALDPTANTTLSNGSPSVENHSLKPRLPKDYSLRGPSVLALPTRLHPISKLITRASKGVRQCLLLPHELRKVLPLDIYIKPSTLCEASSNVSSSNPVPFSQLFIQACCNLCPSSPVLCSQHPYTITGYHQHCHAPYALFSPKEAGWRIATCWYHNRARPRRNGQRREVFNEGT